MSAADVAVRVQGESMAAEMVGTIRYGVGLTLSPTLFPWETPETTQKEGDSLLTHAFGLEMQQSKDPPFFVYISIRIHKHTPAFN